LQALHATGANSVSIVVTQYLDSVTSDTISPTDMTESDTNLELAIEQSQADGLSVMLKPQIDINDGTWRALLEPDNVNAFFANYETFILHYAAIAQATHASMFCIGSELASLSGSVYQSQWDNIISGMRNVLPKAYFMSIRTKWPAPRPNWYSIEMNWPAPCMISTVCDRLRPWRENKRTITKFWLKINMLRKMITSIKNRTPWGKNMISPPK
jgi:hypothetical protein